MNRRGPFCVPSAEGQIEVVPGNYGWLAKYKGWELDVQSDGERVSVVCYAPQEGLAPVLMAIAARVRWARDPTADDGILIFDVVPPSRRLDRIYTGLFAMVDKIPGHLVDWAL